MSQLSEAELGATQFARPADEVADSEIRTEVRERAEDVMKHVFPVEEGNGWDAVLDIVLNEFYHEHDALQAIIDGRFINHASGRQLDLIGEMWECYRQTDEGDDHYRARVKANFSRHTSRATIQEMFNVAKTILQTRENNIHIEENFEIEPARADLWIDDVVFHNSGVTVDEFEALMQDVKPAGVKLWATIGEQFTYRSISDYNGDTNDADRAYDGYDINDLDLTDDTGGEGSYGDAYGSAYGGTAYPYHNEPASPIDGATTQDIGAGYADQVTQQLETLN